MSSVVSGAAHWGLEDVDGIDLIRSMPVISARATWLAHFPCQWLCSLCRSCGIGSGCQRDQCAASGA